MRYYGQQTLRSREMLMITQKKQKKKKTKKVKQVCDVS